MTVRPILNLIKEIPAIFFLSINVLEKSISKSYENSTKNTVTNHIKIIEVWYQSISYLLERNDYKYNNFSSINKLHTKDFSLHPYVCKWLC